MKIVKFGASWCGPCRTMDAKLQTCKYPVEHIDVDEDEESVEKYGIRSVPVTMIMDDNGTPLAKWVGLVDVKTIEDKFEELQK